MRPGTCTPRTFSAPHASSRPLLRASAPDCSHAAAPFLRLPPSASLLPPCEPVARRLRVHLSACNSPWEAGRRACRRPARRRPLPPPSPVGLHRDGGDRERRLSLLQPSAPFESALVSHLPPSLLHPHLLRLLTTPPPLLRPRLLGLPLLLRPAPTTTAEKKEESLVTSRMHPSLGAATFHQGSRTTVAGGCKISAAAATDLWLSRSRWIESAILHPEVLMQVGEGEEDP
ncbi:hypothetical protein PR202_gb23791 [Eleusine coracana subsp. coracana]|uniref:Uncharacterized protein n=1 Tax=Eleusine coracana subsp. coracana TaxID=191504 RepID=A0AAV5FJV1_ELECO|nr:hypothetical protein PR202_gb23791 [Eleusine coracana subsp. coracana]